MSHQPAHRHLPAHVGYPATTGQLGGARNDVLGALYCRAHSVT
jgi:hypothetical protein